MNSLQAIEASQSTQRPNILDYSDLRTYLNAWVDYQKSIEPGFSLTKLSKRAGFTSNCYLSNVFAGNRRFTRTVYERIVPFLELESSEVAYLDLLRCSSESRNAQERQRALKRIAQFTAHYKNEIDSIKKHEYLKHWYYVAIREMSVLPDFEPNAYWISRRLKESVPIQDIQKAIDRLTQMGHLKAPVDSGEKLVCHEGLYRIPLSDFYREVFRLAESSINTTNREKRNIQGLSICITQKQYREIQTEISTLLEKVLNMANQTEPTKSSEVYQLSMALFPLTSKKGDMT